MIKEALVFIEEHANQYFVNHLGNTQEPYVVLDSLTQVDNNGGATQRDQVVMTLINIEEEFLSKNVGLKFGSSSPSTEDQQEPLTLYILFSAGHKDYLSALDHISAVLRCFRDTNIFTQATSPSMDPVLEDLRLELFSLSLEQLENVWSTLRLPYAPSVLYRLKLVSNRLNER